MGWLIKRPSPKRNESDCSINTTSENSPQVKTRPHDKEWAQTALSAQGRKKKWARQRESARLGVQAVMYKKEVIGPWHGDSGEYYTYKTVQCGATTENAKRERACWSKRYNAEREKEAVMTARQHYAHQNDAAVVYRGPLSAAGIIDVGGDITKKQDVGAGAKKASYRRKGRARQRGTSYNAIFLWFAWLKKWA